MDSMVTDLEQELNQTKKRICTDEEYRWIKLKIR